MLSISKCPNCLHISFLKNVCLCVHTARSFRFRRKIFSNFPSTYFASRSFTSCTSDYSSNSPYSFKKLNNNCYIVNNKVALLVCVFSKYGHQDPFHKHLSSYDKFRYFDDQQKVNSMNEEKNKTMDKLERDNDASSDSDGEICVIYNYKEERSRAAVEVILDDDEGLVGTVVNAENTSKQVNKRHMPILLKKPEASGSNVTLNKNQNQNASSTSKGTSRQAANARAACSSTLDDDNVVMLESSSSSSSSNRESPEMNVVGDDADEPSIPQNNFVPNHLGISAAEIEAVRANLEGIRYWEYTNLGSGMVNSLKSSNQLVFSVMSYNVLSQALLEEHPYLYRLNDPRALSWEHRSEILLKEFTLANADILCLQEVQQSHLDTFYNRLNGLGYKGIFKQRTGGKGDGAAIYFKKSMFTLQEHSSVEYYQPGVKILDRDNVGLVARLSVNNHRNKHVVVATTHLLFNPRRHDVKLAQMQLLLAEVERFAYTGEHPREKCPMYCPSIITGDMNFEPYTGVYQLLTNGMFRYEGVSSHNLSPEVTHQPLDYHLIPRHLEITDTCQHYSVLTQRPNSVTFQEQSKTIKLYHSDDSTYRSFDDYVKKMKKSGLVNSFTPRPHTAQKPRSVEPSDLPPEGFGTGQLSHHLNLRSVYNHGRYGTNSAEVSTNQDKWVTVDYIFYSCQYSQRLDKVIEGDLKLISRLRLPKCYDTKRMGPIPNLASPSDHYPLAAVFLLK